MCCAGLLCTVPPCGPHGPETGRRARTDGRGPRGMCDRSDVACGARARRAALRLAGFALSLGRAAGFSVFAWWCLVSEIPGARGPARRGPWRGRRPADQQSIFRNFFDVITRLFEMSRPYRRVQESGHHSAQTGFLFLKVQRCHLVSTDLDTGHTTHTTSDMRCRHGCRMCVRCGGCACGTCTWPVRIHTSTISISHDFFLIVLHLVARMDWHARPPQPRADARRPPHRARLGGARVTL